MIATKESAVNCQNSVGYDKLLMLFYLFVWAVNSSFPIKKVRKNRKPHSKLRVDHCW